MHTHYTEVMLNCYIKLNIQMKDNTSQAAGSAVKTHQLYRSNKDLCKLLDKSVKVCF